MIVPEITTAIEAVGVTICQGAEALGVTRQTLDRLVNERGGISPEMALRLAKAFGSTPETWMRLQTAFELAEARKTKAKDLATIRQVNLIRTPHFLGSSHVGRQ